MVENEFVDAEGFTTTQEGVSFREICLRHVSKISEISTKEFRPGYWQKKPVSVGGGVQMSEKYTEDTRDSYVNAVDFLYDLLLPHFDKLMEEASKKIEAEIESELKKCEEENIKRTLWIDKKLKIKRKLFQEISLLLNRLHYFESKTYKE